MKTFVTAIPLFDQTMTVQAYRLCDHNSDKLLGLSQNFQALGDALMTPGLDLVEAVGIAPFTGGLPLLIDINQFQLMMDVPINKNIPAEMLIPVLQGKVKTDADMLVKCANLKDKGYKLALEAPISAHQGPSLLPYMDYVIMSYRDVGNNINTLRGFPRDKTLVIMDVPDMKGYEKLGYLTNVISTGSYYNQPITKGAKDISPLKINALQLLNQANQDDADLALVANTIERDPALSISLLRFINSPAVRVSRRIDSIRSAVAILGQKEMKRWVTVAISVSLADDRPGEITKLSLVRAKFAENLATAYEMGVLAPSLFMAGLFSLLDVILQKPMGEAINEVAVDDKVRKALVDKSGDLYEVLELIYAYEHANWDKVTINMIRNNVEPDMVTDAFINALVWYKELLETIEDPEEEEAAAEGELS